MQIWSHCHYSLIDHASHTYRHEFVMTQSVYNIMFLSLINILFTCTGHVCTLQVHTEGSMSQLPNVVRV